MNVHTPSPTTPSRTGRHRGTRLAAVTAGCLLLAACGSSATATTTAASPTTSATSSGSGGAGFAAYRQCLQQHGVTVPTGTPKAGTGGGAGGTAAAGATRSPADTAARQACASLRPTGGFGGGTTISASALTAFRSCMSDHGVKVPTTTPTPAATTASGARGAGGALSGLNRNDPTVAKALSVCRVLLPTRTPGSTSTATPSS